MGAEDIGYKISVIRSKTSILNTLIYVFCYKKYRPLQSLKWLYQRATSGYADCDIWSFDNYLARVISGGLRRLAITTHGSPGHMTYLEWQTKLRTMAHCFALYNRLDDLLLKEIKETGRDEAYKRHRDRFDIVKKSMHSFIDLFEHLWD
jgi:hypothetical protein